jgi:hypothetical protein
LLEEFINAFGLRIDDNSGKWGESDSADVLVVVEVLLFVTVDDGLLNSVSEELLPGCSHWLFFV